MRRLKEFEPALARIMDVWSKETVFHCEPGLEEIFAEHPRLIAAVSHCTPLSWFPAIALLTAKSCASGGGERIPVGVMDRFFHSLPVMRELATFITQFDQPLGFNELAERFSGETPIDLVLFPEGSNCFFGSPDEIQEFRSPKFVELAVRAEAPLLLAVHTGSEAWAKSFAVPPEIMSSIDLLPPVVAGFLKGRLEKSGRLTVPLFPAPLERFEMRCELYRPGLRKEELSEDATERLEQLRVEANKVREKMRDLLGTLRNLNTV